MKKRLLYIVMVNIIVIMLFGLVHAEPSTISVSLDGKQILYNDNTGLPFDSDGIIYVPFIKTFEAMDAEVTYFKDVSVIIAKISDNTSSYEVGSFLKDSKRVKVNLEYIGDDVVCKIVNDKVYFPLKVVFEAIDCKVESKSSNINISSRAGDLSKPPVLTIDAPKSSSKDFVDVEIKTIAQAKLFIDGDDVVKSNNNMYSLKVNELHKIQSVLSDELITTSYVRIKGNDHFLKTSHRYINSGDVMIYGETNDDAILTINGRKCGVSYESFTYMIKLDKGEEKTITIISKDSTSGEILKKKLKFPYKKISDNNTDKDHTEEDYVKKPPKDSENKDTEEERVQTVITDQVTDDLEIVIGKPKHPEEGDQDVPTLVLDEPIPSVVKGNKLKITGYVTNTTKIAINGGTSAPVIEMSEYGDKHRFEFLLTPIPNNTMTDKGMFSFFQVYLRNNNSFYVESHNIYFDIE